MTRFPRQPSRFPFFALAVAALAVASLLFYLHFRAAAFPENAIQRDVTREQAAVRSADFLLDVVGQDVSDYNATTVWDFDGDPKTYLEKEFGVERTSELADQIDLWYYSTRYVRPLQKEEFRVFVAPDGRVSGYMHLIDEAAPGAHLSRDEALQLAEAARQDLVPVAGEWRLIEGTATEQPARRDWSFVWERTDLQLPATGPDGRDVGQTRLIVVIQGDQVGQVTRGLKVPEGWLRDYEQIRSANALAMQMATLLGLLPLALAALVVFVRHWTKRDLRWRTALVLGLVGAVLSAAASLNALPIAFFGYDTTMAWEAFISLTVSAAVFSGVPHMLAILFFGAAGEALYRARFPEHLSLRASFSWRGAMTKRGAVALALGSSLAIVFFAYQIAYYLMGASIGFWVPADSGSQNIYSFFAPWFVPVSDSFNAAVSEEFGYRLFAIPLLTLLFGRVLRPAGAAQWLAIVVSAFAWGFLHSNYPNDPFYARGLEIGLAGIFFGWLMVRFGILASLALHYSFDALWGASALDNSGSLSMILLAYGFVVIPFAISAVSVVRAALRGGFEPEEALLNNAESAAATAEAIERPAPVLDVRYPGLARGQRRAVLVAGAVGLIALVVAAATMPFYQAYPVSAGEAGARADAALADAGVDLAGYQRVVTLQDLEDGNALAYLREHADSNAPTTLYRSIFPATEWRVRYSRPLTRDEYRVYIPTDAAPGTSPSRIVYNLGDDTPGARLSAEEAQQWAEAGLRDVPAWRDATMTLVDVQTVERSNRTDYTFVYERDDGRVADASIRARIDVVGDRVSGYSPFVKLPEEWVRERSAVSLKQVAGTLGGTVVGIAMAVLAVLAFLRLARERLLPLRSSAYLAAVVGLLGLIGEINNIAAFYDGYDTTTPVPTFLVMQLVGKAATLAGASVLAAVAWSLLVGFWRSEVGPVVASDNRLAWVKDAVLLSPALALVHLGTNQALAAIDARLPFDTAASAPVGVATYLPALAAVSNIPSQVLMAAVIIVAYLLLRRTLRGGRQVLLACLSLPLIAGFSQQTVAEGLMAGVGMLALLLLVAVTVRWLARANLAALLGAAIASDLLFSALTLVRSGDGWLVVNGLSVVVVTLAGLVGFAFMVCRARPDSAVLAALPPGGEDDGSPEGRLAA